MKITVSELRKLISESLGNAVEREIAAAQNDPAFDSIESFAEWKLDNDNYSYNFIELQALARNLTQAEVPNASVARRTDIDHVKRSLNDLGFKFFGREPEVQVRGFTSSAHGTHPYANSGAGGSGFGNSGFTSFGGGPGAIGGGASWKPGDSRNLSMGSKKR